MICDRQSNYFSSVVFVCLNNWEIAWNYFMWNRNEWKRERSKDNKLWKYERARERERGWETKRQMCLWSWPTARGQFQMNMPIFQPPTNVKFERISIDLYRYDLQQFEITSTFQITIKWIKRIFFWNTQQLRKRVLCVFCDSFEPSSNLISSKLLFSIILSWMTFLILISFLCFKRFFCEFQDDPSSSSSAESCFIQWLLKKMTKKKIDEVRIWSDWYTQEI